ncbi:MAG: 5-formyltetrahydrofolate cyclo-ligase [Gaiellales bacterium]
MDKRALRDELRARRSGRTADELEAWGALLAAHAPVIPGRTVTAFIGIGGEVPTLPLIDALVADGRRILLPITLDDLTLDWAEYTGADGLARSDYGLLEPTGARLGFEGIAEADTILAPALAIDRAGRRLGQGGGCYDKSLPIATGEVIAVVADDEVLDEVPTEPHDQPVDAVLTPAAGLMRVPRA